MSSSNLERRAFVRRENLRLGDFLAEAGSELVRWSRQYLCACGFACTEPGAMWDHSLSCKRTTK